VSHLESILSKGLADEERVATGRLEVYEDLGASSVDARQGRGWIWRVFFARHTPDGLRWRDVVCEVTNRDFSLHSDQDCPPLNS
jgi:hypothetical protein